MPLKINHDRRLFASLIYDKLNTFHGNTSKFASLYLSGTPKFNVVLCGGQRDDEQGTAIHARPHQHAVKRQ
jgi:hypothetical protein